MLQNNPHLPWNEEHNASIHPPPLLEEETASMLRECHGILGEIEQFHLYLDSRWEEVEMRRFRNNVRKECTLLQKLATADPTDPKTAQTLRCSNLSNYAAVWGAVKGCSGIVCLGKRFYSIGKIKRTSAMVDIVAQGGLEWVKVSTITEKRLLFEIAKARRVGAAPSGDVDMYDSNEAAAGEGDDEHMYDSDEGRAEEDDDDEVEGLLKLAKTLFKASRKMRVRYRHPRIRMVLPNLGISRVKEVEAILKQIEAMGITIQRAGAIEPAPPVSHVLDRMMPNPFAEFTGTINIDCTILLALVSDLSHSSVETENWQHRAVQRQVEMERGCHLLPNFLWPACGARELVCNQEAAQKMHEIVDVIGSDSEKRRRDFFMETDATNGLSRQQRVAGLQELSAYPVPTGLKLPIRAVKVDIPGMESQIGRLALAASPVLSDINKSVFFYGWLTGMTTLSSNGTTAKEIEMAVEAYRGDDAEMGPDIWLSPTARSLNGKEKTRRNWNN